MDVKSIKEKVLQEIMQAMDERSVNELKSKSPKFAKVDIKSNDPSLADSLKDKLMGESDLLDEEKNELPKEMNKELMDPSLENKETPESDDDIKRLLEMYKNLK